MIQLIPQLRILIACQPIDFRNGIDGLAALCKQKLAEDPFSGALFVFRNRRGSALKLLCYDGYGYWLITRRLSEGRLRWWPDHPDMPLSSRRVSTTRGSSLQWPSRDGLLCRPLS
jgi:transposase